jgi:hypothetical protein
MTKSLNQIIFFFLHQNQNIFFSNIGNQNIFLEIRRLTTIAVETFKIIHKQSPSYLHDLISIKDQKYNFRHQGKAVLPRVRTTRYGLNSFRYNAVQIWNELPNHFRQETSLEHFQNIIHTWNGSSCQCSAFLSFHAF